jgi:hypothetical protein
MLTTAAPPDGGGTTSRSRRIRAFLVPLVLIAATLFYALWVDRTLPIRHWLIFQYLRYWLFVALFISASVVSGWRLLRHLVDQPPVLGERLLLATGLGVLLFVLGIFLTGLAGLLGSVFFFAWPALLLAYGGPGFWRDARRIRSHLSTFGARLFLPRTIIETLAVCLALISVLAIYLQVITPSNLSADSHWYHLPIAEHYAAAGKIRAFADGWYLATYPQLASLLYTWAFLSPGQLFDHVALASHIEFSLFLATLAGIGTLTRRLLGDGTRTPFAGAGIFLFPALYLYDSSLNTGADHVLAFWMPPIAIALVRLGQTFGTKQAALAACMLAGALLTKLQGVYLVAPIGLFVLALAIGRRKVRPLLMFCALCLLVTSPHWLKNWVFYGDPQYPTLHAYFSPHPFHARAGAQVEHTFFEPQFVMHGTPLEKVGETLSALVNYALIPHDFGFHRDRPVIGALFTLLLPLLLLVRPRRRLVLMVIGVHMGIAAWYIIKHQDRYLQILMPWMASVTVALLVLAWRQGWLARGAVALLVALQLVWGADIYFIRSHAMIGDSFLKATIDFLSAGHDKRYEERFRLPGSLEEVAPKLPRGAKVMQHEIQEKLGLGAQAICDMPEWQGALEYLIQDVPADVERLWRQLGATHVLWMPRKGGPWEIDKLAREAVFHRTLEPFLNQPTDIGSYRLVALPAAGMLAVEATPTRIAWLSCAGDPPNGLYTAADLAERKPLAPLNPAALQAAPEAALSAANVVILRSGCGEWSFAPPLLERVNFHHRFQSGEHGLWVRGQR